MIPLLGSFLKENQPSANATSVPNQTLSSAELAELQSQARGYELVLQREPDNRTALRGLLDVRLQLGDLKGTLEPLEKLASLNPEQTDYMVLLAQAKQKIGDREGAAQAYRTILASKPGDMNALQGLVSLLVQQKRPEAAIGLLEDTLKISTQVNQNQPASVDVASVQLLLAQVYFNEQRYAEAIAIYDEAIKSNIQDFRPVLAKALVLQQLGKSVEAKPLFKTAVSLAPAQYKDQIKQMAKVTAATPTPTSSPSITPSSSPAVGTPSPSR
ncbi:MAG: tetratricopeptide repeat protein [Aphanothece sp. CMT-3BRIN-NPC111]|jgi:tetratricopeptide (TPR) repeat protein|nr:tetratricopeptide repeat protein [Aphanothece sp. CMT-3BRIN-NPC111]